MTHDYKRHGTTTLFAALNVLTGEVIGQCHGRHRHQEFLKFLRRLDRAFPRDLTLHVILDNYATHKHKAIRKWLAAHPRFKLFAAGEEAWPEARYLTETARRAMETRPAMMDLLPHQLREQWKVQESRNRPKEILERIAKSVDWEDRYTVRRAFLAVCPHERDEVVVGGEPGLSAHYNVRDGYVTLRLESSAWERHGLTPPEGRVSAPTALILAGQTKQQLEHEQLQNAVDRLVWSDDTEEIDQVAATLAADPHGLLKPTPADDGAGPGGRYRNRIDFGRAKDRETVQLYEQRLEEE